MLVRFKQLRVSQVAANSIEFDNSSDKETTGSNETDNRAKGDKVRDAAKRVEGIEAKES